METINVFLTDYSGNLTVTSTNLQGPQGLPGRDGVGSGGGISLEVFKSGNINGIGGHRIVYLDNNSSLQYATNLDILNIRRIIGITTNSAAIGGDITVQKTGEITEPSWRFDLSSPIYLGSNGTLTQVYPTFPSLACVVIGFPIRSDTIYINIEKPIITN